MNLITRRLGKATRGAAAAEYVMLIAGIAVTLILSLTVFGGDLSKLYQGVVNKLPGSSAAPLPGSGPAKAVSCVDGSNDNHYFDNRFWAMGTDYQATGDGSWMGTMVHGSSGDVWVGNGSYTDLTVDQAKAQGVPYPDGNGGVYPDYWMWSKTNNFAAAPLATPPASTPDASNYLSCLYGKDTPVPTDPNVCLDGYNGNGYFNNKYWSTATNYYEYGEIGGAMLRGAVVHAASGDVWVGQEGQDGYTPTSAANAFVQDPNGVFVDYPFWAPTDVYGGALTTDASSVDPQFLVCSDYTPAPVPNAMDKYTPTLTSVLGYRTDPVGGYCAAGTDPMTYNTNVPNAAVYFAKDYNAGTEYIGPEGSVFYNRYDGTITPWVGQFFGASSMYWVVDAPSVYPQADGYPTPWANVPQDSNDVQVGSYQTVTQCSWIQPSCTVVGYYKVFQYVSIAYDERTQSMWEAQDPIGTVRILGSASIGGPGWRLGDYYKDDTFSPTDVLDHQGVYFVLNAQHYAYQGYFWVAVRAQGGTKADPQVWTYAEDPNDRWSQIKTNLFTGVAVGESGVTDVRYPYFSDYEKSQICA